MCLKWIRVLLSVVVRQKVQPCPKPFNDILKKITGHKTASQLSRYVNINTDDVAQIMHGRQPDDLLAPAALTPEKLASLFNKEALPENNVVRLDFARRTA